MRFRLSICKLCLSAWASAHKKNVFQGDGVYRMTDGGKRFPVLFARLSYFHHMKAGHVAPAVIDVLNFRVVTSLDAGMTSAVF